MRPALRGGLGGLALVLILAPGAVLAAQSLAGDWRPRGADTADPALTALDCAPGDQDCQEEHGTFVTDVYLRIVQDDTTGALGMTSTGALSASVSPRKGRDRLFDVAMDGGGRASLHLGSSACGGAEACFEVTGTSDATALADGVLRPGRALAARQVAHHVDQGSLRERAAQHGPGRTLLRRHQDGS